MRTHTKNMLEPRNGRLALVQNVALRGFCMAARWDKVPKIWKKIKSTTNDVGSRRILKRYCERYRIGGLLFYNIYWEDELFTPSGQ